MTMLRHLLFVKRGLCSRLPPPSTMSDAVCPRWRSKMHAHGRPGLRLRSFSPSAADQLRRATQQFELFFFEKDLKWRTN